MFSPAHHIRLRWIAAILFGLGAFTISEVWLEDDAAFHCEIEDFAVQVVGGLSSFVAMVFGVGVWLGQEWARPGCGIGGLLIPGWSLWSKISMDRSWAEFLDPRWRTSNLLFALCMGVLLAVAVYCLFPSTKRMFAAVRERRARGRATAF